MNIPSPVRGMSPTFLLAIAIAVTDVTTLCRVLIEMTAESQDFPLRVQSSIDQAFKELAANVGKFLESLGPQLKLKRIIEEATDRVFPRRDQGRQGHAES